MAEGNFGLMVQRLPSSDAVLALAQVASWRTEDRWFETRNVSDLHLALRLPAPKNLSDVLGRLRAAGLLIHKGEGRLRWALTPEGERRAERLIGNFDYHAIAAELRAVPGAFFAHTDYATLTPSLAPPAWAQGIGSFLARHPFETNAFLMTRFPKEPEVDLLVPVIERLREELDGHGLTLHTADDQQIVDDLWSNVGAHMWACRYGVGILETRTPRTHAEDRADHRSETLNDNVLMELASMLTIGRRCMILKDDQAPMPPTDLTSQIFKSVDLADIDAVASRVEEWVTKDLRLH